MHPTVEVVTTMTRSEDELQQCRVALCPQHWHTSLESEPKQGNEDLCIPSSMSLSSLYKLLQLGPCLIQLNENSPQDTYEIQNFNFKEKKLETYREIGGQVSTAF